MARLLGSLSMSLDGYVALPDDTIGPLFDWYDAGDVDVPTARPDMTWHVDEGSAALLREMMAQVRALFIGRRFFQMMDGWGGRHPFGYGIPIVVPVRSVPDGWPREDRPDVTFVTGGLPAAVDRAHQIAGGGLVGVGGARTIQAVLEAALLDELHVALVPALLGNGIRFFESVAGAPVLFDDPTVIPGKRVTHLRYAVRRVTRLESRPVAESRLGFLRGAIRVPDDFDQLGRGDIAADFGSEK